MKKITRMDILNILIVFIGCGILGYVLSPNNLNNYGDIVKLFIWFLLECFFLALVIKFNGYKGKSTVFVAVIVGFFGVTLIWLIPMGILPGWSILVWQAVFIIVAAWYRSGFA